MTDSAEYPLERDESHDQAENHDGRLPQASRLEGDELHVRAHGWVGCSGFFGGHSPRLAAPSALVTSSPASIGPAAADSQVKVRR